MEIMGRKGEVRTMEKERSEERDRNKEGGE